jgi:hypothetical protein
MNGTANWIRPILAGAALLAFMVFVSAIVLVPNIHLSDTMIGMILGYLSSLVKDAYNYYYGTTANRTAEASAIITAASKTP